MADTVDPDPPPPPPIEEVPPTVAVTQPVNKQPVTPIPGEAPPPREGCMAKRSGLEKCLLVLVIIIVIICIFFAAAFLINWFFSTSPEGACLTDSCMKAANRLKARMNEEIDPCNNFYQYACGGWMDTKVLEPNEDQHDSLTDIRHNFYVNMRNLLRDFESDDPAYKTLPGEFYQECMNTERLEERGAQPFMEFVDSIEEFPALDPDWNETDFNLNDAVTRLAKIGVTPLFSIIVDPDLMDPNKNKIYFGDAVLSLGSKTPYKGGRDNQVIKFREEWLVDILVMLGADRDQAQVDVGQVLDLEISIAMLMRDPVEKEDLEAKYNEEAIGQIHNTYRWLDWLTVMREVGRDTAIGGFLTKRTDTVINQEGNYLAKLGELLKDTDKRVLANFMMSHTIQFTSWLGEEFRRKNEMYIKLTQDKSPMSRWKMCIDQAAAIYPEAVSRLYIESHFDKEAKKDVEAMVKDLKLAFTSMLASASWMSVETREEANDKLKRLETKIGYPESILDDDRLNKLYKSVSSKENSKNYFEKMVAARKYKVKQDLIRLGEENKDRKRWKGVYPTSLNVRYNEMENELVLPAAMLQPPLYSPEYPSSQNVGSIGSIIGAEITKGFGKNGSRYDSLGDRNQWWTDDDKNGYKAQSVCFVDQYGCYKWEGNSIDGDMTLAENIADNGGLRQSFKAYRAKIKREGTEEKRLPSLDLDHNQIFFLSFAQTYCAQIRDKAKQSIVETGPHSPHPYRVYGALQNSEDFAKAFKCKGGSRMNPLRKCKMF